MFGNEYKNVGVIVLVAGRGTRLGCVDYPKVMLEVGGKPMVSYVVETLKHLGFSREQICLVVGFQKQVVMDYFGNSVIYAHQDEQLGTGHAVLVAKSQMKRFSHILVLYGDMPFLSEYSVKKMISRHTEEDAVLTQTTVRVPDFSRNNEPFSHYGRIVRGGHGQILKSVEEKDASEEEKRILELNTGYICARSDWLWKSLDEIENTNAQNEYYLTDLLEIAVNQGHSVGSVQIESREALGINTKGDLEEAGQKNIQ
ncbi:MAG: NTP transferase domain-containing protein [Candidatus Magasanikbacteria bacterium]